MQNPTKMISPDQFKNLESNRKFALIPVDFYSHFFFLSNDALFKKDMAKDVVYIFFYKNMSTECYSANADLQCSILPY